MGEVRRELAQLISDLRAGTPEHRRRALTLAFLVTLVAILMAGTLAAALYDALAAA